MSEEQKKLIDELLGRLDDIARDVDGYDYGLPMFNEDATDVMRQAVFDWLNKTKSQPAHWADAQDSK